MTSHPRKTRAQQLLQKGRLKQAQAIYTKLVRENPRDAESFYMLGCILGQRGHFAEAAKQYRKTLKIQPNAIVAICGLGAACKEMGDYLEAEKAFLKALRMKPDFTDVKLELAAVYLLQERIEEAESLLKNVIRSTPDSAVALEGLGEINHFRRNLDQAIQYYKDALRIEPQRKTALNRLGFAYHTLGRLDEAVETYRKALAIDPRFADSWNNMGSSLLTAGKLDEARKAFEQTLKLSPKHIGALTNIATVSERQGDHEGAYHAIRPLLKKGIKDPSIGIVYTAICRKLGKCEAAADYLETVLNEVELPPTRQEYVHFALGKLYDQMERYDEAFQHYRKGNELRPDTFSSGVNAAHVDAIIRVFSREFMAAAPRSDIEGRLPLPVFIIGMPRSGTSLTEQILARHSDVHGGGELTDIGYHAAQLAQELDPTRGFPAAFKKIDHSLLTETAGHYLGKLESLSGGAALVTDKMPQNFMHLGLISLLFPGARIIHCTRDPRDTCLSIYFQHFNEAHDYSSRLENIAEYYKGYIRLMNHWKSVVDVPILEMRYEDLINDQEQQTRRLLDFLGLEWDERCLDFHRSERHVPTSSYDQVRQPIYKRSVGRWRHYKAHLRPLVERLRALHENE